MLYNNIYINVRPNDAKKRVDLTKEMAAQKISQKEIIPIHHSVLEEIEPNNRAIVLLVSYVST